MTSIPISLPAWVSLVTWVVLALCVDGALVSAGFVLAARRAGDAGRAEWWKGRLAVFILLVVISLGAQFLVTFHWHVT